METIRRVVKIPDFVDTDIIKSYLEEIKSLEGKLQVVKKEIFFLEDVGDGVQRASNIDVILFNLYQWPLLT